MGMADFAFEYRGFIIDRHHCNCHSETCCCYKYEITIGSKLVSRADSVKEAKTMIDIIITNA